MIQKWSFRKFNIFVFLAHVKRLLGVLGLCISLWPAAVQAQDYILERSYWADTTGTATFEQARSASYTPYSGVLSKGFTEQAHWIKLRVDGLDSGAINQLVLRIRPVFLDNITLYDPLEWEQGKAVRAAGDRTPLMSAEFDSLNHSFVIPSHPVARDVWLRLSTSSTHLMHVEALSPRDMLRSEQSLWLAYSALLAILFSSLIWVLSAWLQDREPVNGVFVLRQTVLLVYTACYLGYHRIVFDGLLTPFGQDLFYCWALLLTTGLTFVFEYRLLREYAIPKWGYYLLRTCLAVSFLLHMLLLTGYRNLALQGNTIITGLSILFLLMTAIGIPRKASSNALAAGRYLLPKRAIVTYYVFVLIALGVSILPSLGVLVGSVLSIYGVLFYGLLSGLFMTTLLIVRSRQIDRFRQEQANHLFLSRQQLEIETRRRQEQSQLLNMLMHELKNPLAVIEMALRNHTTTDKNQSYVHRAIENMKSVLNRCVQSDRLVDRPLQVQSQRFDFARQLQQWLQDNKRGKGRISFQAPSIALVETDLQCVQIIASNLIDNALKYGDLQKPVQVILEAKAHADGRPGWSLRVRNAPGSAGWPQAEQVFAKYYRSPAAQRQSGTGLGLFLSHSLALQLGGVLTYCPDSSHIAFELWLPT